VVLAPQLPWLVRKATAVCRKACNKYDQTALLLLLSVSDWSIIMIRPGGLLLVVPRIYLLLSQFEFYGWGLQKSTELNLDVQKYLLRVTYSAQLEMLVLILYITQGSSTLSWAIQISY
jgi:hypothetical protein